MNTKSLLIAALTTAICTTTLPAQVALTTPGSPVVVTFDASLAGVNNGAYTAAAGGVSTAPVAGQLNTNAWAFTGLSDGNVAFGGALALGDYSRGTSNGGVTTGGLYGFDVSNGGPVNRALGIQQTAADLTSGYVYLRLLNSTGSTLTQLDISYNIYYYNDQDNSESVCFAYSSNNVNYKTLYALDYRTPELLAPATWNSVTKSTSITNINIPNGSFYYLRWTVNDLSPSFSRDEFALDNISITPIAGGCLAGTEPTTPASNLQFWFPSCNGVILKWTGGNGSKRVVVAKQGSPVTTLPSDLSSYVASPNFGATSQTTAGEFVVYNGTGNAVAITGLTAGTTYYFAVVEYNGTACGENYLTSSVLTGNVATTATCSACPQLTTAYINACNGVCGEGTNELLIFTTGGWYVPIRRDEDWVPNDMILFGNASPANIDYTAGFTSMPATVASMNTAVGPCSPAVFYDGLSIDVMPPNTNFILLPETFCTPSSYTYAGLCGHGPIYVFFTSDLSWNSGGNFTHANSPSVTRYFRTDFSFLTGPSCLLDYDYTTGFLSGTDGDYAIWNGPGSAVLYGNSACGIPSIVLPIEWLSFTAERHGTAYQTDIHWSTATEQDNASFEVLRSTDGIDWKIIAQQPGAGTSTLTHYYNAIDAEPEDGINYYRIKQIDVNGQFSYSSIVPVMYSNTATTFSAFPSPSTGLFTLEGPLVEGDVLEVFDLAGQEVIHQSISRTTPREDLDLTHLAAGVYLLQINGLGKTPQTLRIVIQN